MTPPGSILAEVVRSGFVESIHTGSYVAVAPGGEVLFAGGDPEEPVFPRSSNKPMQAVACVERGYDGEGALLAIAAASHSGEQRHVDLVRALLAGADVPESALGCPRELPLDEAAARAVLARGGEPQRITHNCSGKHAAMLAACAAKGEPLGSYLDPRSDLQVTVREVVERLTGEAVTATGVDGCGAPLYAVSLTGLALAYSRLVLAEPGTPERRVADAMREHPEVVGGTGRDVTALMRGVPGLLAKEGAEGVCAAALPDGTALALKVDDGAGRARMPVLHAMLRRLGVHTEAGAAPPVLGGGLPVGEVRAVAP